MGCASVEEVSIEAAICKSSNSIKRIPCIFMLQNTKLIQKLVKQRKDSLAIYEKQGREDLAATEKEEIEGEDED